MMHNSLRKLIASFARVDATFTITNCGILHITRKSFCSSLALMAGKVIPFKLADIGEGITEVKILTVKVKPGTVLNEFDEVCEVQSDKATVNITSPYTGNVINVHIKAGESATVGQPILDLELCDESNNSMTDMESKMGKKTDTSKHDFHAENTENYESNTNEASMQIAKDTEVQRLSNYQQDSSSVNKSVLATPATRYLAKQNNIELSNIRPTGKGGRVTKEDVLSFLNMRQSNSAIDRTCTNMPITQSNQQAKPKVAEYAVNVEEGDSIIEIVGVRKGMMKTMTAAASIACFGFSDEYNMSELIKVKNELKDVVMNASNGQVKLTLMPFFIKATALALLEYPELNAHCSASCDLFVRKSKINIGVAMDTPSGLIVPVVKDVAHRSIYDIAVELQRLVNKGRSNRLEISDLTGGTFTLSNIGVIGAVNTSPVLLPPQVAIAAIGRLQRLPRFVTNAQSINISSSSSSSSSNNNNQIEMVEMVNISFNADHRVIDGATAVRFANCMKRYIEHPAQMTLHLK